MKKYKTGYTAGAFDVLHVGHLNLLERAKNECEYLIVGVTCDEIIEKTKNHTPVIPQSERMRIVSALRCVDKVVLQDDLDKVKAWEKLHYDVLFSGSDWRGVERWKRYEIELKKRGAKVIYFPYTQNVSSTKIREKLSESRIKAKETVLLKADKE